MYISGFREIDKMKSDKSSGVPVSHPKVFRKLGMKLQNNIILCIVIYS